MAEAVLNPGIAALDLTSDLYNLYDKLYNGMSSANSVDPPSVSSDTLMRDNDGNVIFDPITGEPQVDPTKEAAIRQTIADYQDIMMRNSAYMLASAFMSVMGGSGAGTGGGPSTGGGAFVYRHGDSMAGSLGALYGFEAGFNNTKIFETVFQGAENTPWAIVSGNLRVTEDAFILGKLNLSNDGIYFNSNQVIYYDNGVLNIDCADIKMTGDIVVDGSITIGSTVIDENGIFSGINEYYHSGNSNKSDVDWTMKDANVYGDLIVDGESTLRGALTSEGGFKFAYYGHDLLYSANDTLIDENDGSIINNPYIVLDSDLSIINGNGIKFNDKYIIKTKDGATPIVSFAAPGMIMNLGDTVDGVATSKITLQSDLYDYTGNIKLISKTGDGYFPNSLVVGHLGAQVFETYQTSNIDLGVLFNHYVRFGDSTGPAIHGDGDKLEFVLPYSYLESGNPNALQLPVAMYFADTTSPFRDLSAPWSATLHFDTDAEFFAFDKPVEAEYFAIKSELYKTRLIENTLFFDDEKYLEGVVDGIRYFGNAYFDGDLFAADGFTSGFAGSGWAILSDQWAGGIHATFDALTIRKKMRVYELEVQKISITNGSLWVSDSCSGDEVRVLT